MSIKPKIFGTIMAALLLSSTSFAKCIRFSEFDACSASPQVIELLKSDRCAKAAVLSVKKNILDQAAMNEGYDLPETVTVSYLKNLAKNSAHEETYSVSMKVGIKDPSIDMLVQTKRALNNCSYGLPYNAGL